jgi:hypothetical protein
MENKIIYLLYILGIDSSVFKSVKISSIVCRFVQKISKKNNYRVAMTNMTWATRAWVQCWRNYEYFRLKQCLENIGEGLLHACISSISTVRPWFFNSRKLAKWSELAQASAVERVDARLFGWRMIDRFYSNWTFQS